MTTIIVTTQFDDAGDVKTRTQVLRKQIPTYLVIKRKVRKQHDGMGGEGNGERSRES